jgi:hypothetical protein
MAKPGTIISPPCRSGVLGAVRREPAFWIERTDTHDWTVFMELLII